MVSASGVTPLLLIDGQQRITTLTLLIAAFADFDRCHPDAQSRFSHAEIMGRGYLLDEYKKGEDRYRLTLSQGDKATLMLLLDDLDDSDVRVVDESSCSIENFGLFRKKSEALADPNVVWESHTTSRRRVHLIRRRTMSRASGLEGIQLHKSKLTGIKESPRLLSESRAPLA